MSRAAANAAGNQLRTTNQIGSGFNSQGSNIYSSLEPQLQKEATNPQGFSPADLSAMKTGSAQALGGVTSGITGQENLQVARNRNSAGYNATLDDAARSAGQQQSQNELGIDAANAQLKQQQQQTALSSLGNLYNTSTSAGESYYGMAPSTINALTAASPGWVQSLGGFISDLGQGGKGAGAVMQGVNA